MLDFVIFFGLRRYFILTKKGGQSMRG